MSFCLTDDDKKTDGSLQGGQGPQLADITEAAAAPQPPFRSARAPVGKRIAFSAESAKCEPPMNNVLAETADLSHITSVISQTAAPAFVLGAVAGFLSILISRLERTADRARDLRKVGPIPDSIKAKGDFLGPALRRQELLYRSIYFAVLCALTTATLVLLAFAAALFEIRHERIVALLFIVALMLFMISLVYFLREIGLAIRTRHLDS
jgi:hypothetical protein